MSFLHCVMSQSREQRICDCIEENYNGESWDYFKELDAFNTSLIQMGKISDSFDSKISLLEEVSTWNLPDFHLEDFSERLFTFGDESLRYCIRRAQFNEDCTDRHWSNQLVKKLEMQKIFYARSPTEYKEVSAKTIIKAMAKAEGESKLKNSFMLQELYRRIPNTAEYNLDQLSSKFKEKKEIPIPEDATRIHVNDKSEIQYGLKIIEINQMCESIDEALTDQQVILLSCNKKTIYKTYLEVFNTLKTCIADKRNQVALENFNLGHDQLNDDQKIELSKIFEVKIMEEVKQ